MIKKKKWAGPYLTVIIRDSAIGISMLQGCKANPPIMVSGPCSENSKCFQLQRVGPNLGDCSAPLPPSPPKCIQCASLAES